MLFYNPVVYRPRQRSGPGCLFFVFCFLALVVVGWYSTQTGLLAALLDSKPIISLPLSVQSGLVLAHQPPPSYTETGQPSVSATFVNQLLAHAHSPATGTGQALYDLSRKYGIDDVYALAFFEHESAFGTSGIATVTRSLGNIRCSNGYQCIQGYRAYNTWVTGYEDWYRLMRTLYVETWHLTTVETIIPVYAPARDGNDVSGYIRAVEQAVNAWKQGKAQ